MLCVTLISKRKHINVSASLTVMMTNSSATFRLKHFSFKYCHFHDLMLFFSILTAKKYSTQKILSHF